MLAEGVHGAAQLRAAAAAQLYCGAFTAQHGHLRVRCQDTRSARWAAGAVGGQVRSRRRIEGEQSRAVYPEGNYYLFFCSNNVNCRRLLHAFCMPVCVCRGAKSVSVCVYRCVCVCGQQQIASLSIKWRRREKQTWWNQKIRTDHTHTCVRTYTHTHKHTRVRMQDTHI